MQADLHLFNLVHQYVGKYKYLDNLGRFSAEYPGYLVLILVGMVAQYIHHWQLFFLPLFAGLVARFIVNEAVYAFCRRKRPSEVLAFTPLVPKPKHSSFPSGHASFFGGFAFLLLAYSTPLAMVCIGTVLVMCLARVFCGVHWPSDILAGMSVALAVTLLFWHSL